MDDEKTARTPHVRTQLVPERVGVGFEEGQEADQGAGGRGVRRRGLDASGCARARVRGRVDEGVNVMPAVARGGLSRQR